MEDLAFLDAIPNVNLQMCLTSVLPREAEIRNARDSHKESVVLSLVS